MNFIEFLDQFVSGAGLALLFGVITATITGIGSARAVGRVGSVVTGVLEEDPSLFGRALVLQALPGTQGIYGLLVWFFIFLNVGFFDGSYANVSVTQGLLYGIATLPMMIVGYFSATYQGAVAADGVILMSKRPSEMVKALILAAMVETYAIFALLASILSILFI